MNCPHENTTQNFFLIALSHMTVKLQAERQWSSLMILELVSAIALKEMLTVKRIQCLTPFLKGKLKKLLCILPKKAEPIAYRTDSCYALVFFIA